MADLIPEAPEPPRHEISAKTYPQPGVPRMLWRWECSCGVHSSGWASRQQAEDDGDRHVIIRERDEALAREAALRAQVEAARRVVDRFAAMPYDESDELSYAMAVQRRLCVNALNEALDETPPPASPVRCRGRVFDLGCTLPDGHEGSHAAPPAALAGPVGAEPAERGTCPHPAACTAIGPCGECYAPPAGAEESQP